MGKEQVPTCEVENRPGHNTLSDVVTDLKVRRQYSLKKTGVRIQRYFLWKSAEKLKAA